MAEVGGSRAVKFTKLNGEEHIIDVQPGESVREVRERLGTLIGKPAISLDLSSGGSLIRDEMGVLPAEITEMALCIVDHEGPEIPIVNALRDMSLVICGGTHHPKFNQRVHDAPCIAPGTLGRLAVVPREQLEGPRPNEADEKHWVQVRAAFPGYQRPAHVGSDDYWESSDVHGVLEGEQDEADCCITQPIDGIVEPGYNHACIFEGMVWRHPEHGLAFDGIELYYNSMGGHLEDTSISLAAGEGTTMRRLRRFSETYGIELSVAFATVENGGRRAWALVVSQDNAKAAMKGTAKVKVSAKAKASPKVLKKPAAKAAAKVLKKPAGRR